MFAFVNIRSYHRFLATHPQGCSEVVEHYLERVRQFGRLNAFLEVYEEEAKERARQLDEKRALGAEKLGKLHGVIIALKDVISYKDHSLSAASHILDDFRTVYHATVVEKLLAEDAILLGRTNCDEFAMGSTNENSAFGPVLNALDESRVSGGSSGGSAVAVQAGLCMVSLGSDTGGSVRQPADFCGVVGLKPTYGRVSRHGLIAYASSCDQIGIFALQVEDVALTLEVIAGADAFDSTCSPRPVPPYQEKLDTNKAFENQRIALFREVLDHPGLDPEIKRSFEKLIKKLREAGHQVDLIDFKYLDYIVPAYYVITTAEASTNLSRYDGVKYGHRTTLSTSDLTDFYKKTRAEGFGKEVKRRILLGTFVLSAGYYDAFFARAQSVRNLLVQYTDLIFKDYDVILSPTAPSTAFKIGEKMDDPISMYLADIYTVYANLTGIPACSLPLFRHTNGMPFGIQTMTSRFKEVNLLTFSHHLMLQYKSYENPTL